MRVEAADRDDRALAAQRVPRAQVLGGRVVEHRFGAARNRTTSRQRSIDWPVSVTKLHSSSPLTQSRSRNGMPRALEELRALRERVRREAEAALLLARPRHTSAGERPLFSITVVDPEREVVVLVRRHLLADEQEHVAVPALLAVVARRERVVVGEEHHVHAGLRRARMICGTVPVPSEQVEWRWMTQARSRTWLA